MGNKKIIIISFVILISGIVLGLYNKFDTKKVELKFQKNIYEYGTNISYQDMIIEKNPKDGNMKYPTVEIEKVGKYNVIFEINNNKVKHSFSVIDTRLPKIDLKRQNNPEIIIYSEYDVLENMLTSSDETDGKYTEFEKVKEEEYVSRQKIISNVKKYIDNRDNTSNKKNKEVDLINNTKTKYTFYTTNLDLTTIGTYQVKATVVDSNFNTSAITWDIDVKEIGSIVNTGGVVSCTDIGVEETAMKENVVENQLYTYDEKGVVTKISLFKTYTLDDENKIDELLSTVKEKYLPLDEKTGILKTIDVVKEDTVTLIIVIDMSKYDFLIKEIFNDEIYKKELNMTYLLMEAERNNLICDSKN